MTEMATAHQVRRDEARVAVLVDCANAPPAILEHAVRIAAQFGRVVIRRGKPLQIGREPQWHSH